MRLNTEAMLKNVLSKQAELLKHKIRNAHDNMTRKLESSYHQQMDIFMEESLARHGFVFDNKEDLVRFCMHYCSMETEQSYLTTQARVFSVFEGSMKIRLGVIYTMFETMEQGCRLIVNRSFEFD